MAGFSHIKAWLTKRTSSDDSNEEDYITSSGVGANKRGLDVFSHDYLLEVEKGNVPGSSIIKKFGANSSIGTALVPVSFGAVYQTPSVLTSLEIVSDDDTNDVAGGGGARSVRIWGLSNTNGSWTEEIQDVNLDGTTPVAIPNQMFRVYKMRVLTSGTYASFATAGGSHNSIITVRVAGAGATWAAIGSDDNFGLASSEIGAFSIAKGVTCYLLSISMDIEANKSVTVVGFIRENADTVVAPYSPMASFLIKRSIDVSYEAGDGYALKKIIGPGDIGFMARVAATGAAVDVEFVLLLVDD